MAALLVILAGPAQAGSASPTIGAPTRFVEMEGQRIAYRLIGPSGGVPLLMLNRFRGTMDHWDPALVDRLAASRQVILFDQPGFARSTGTAPDTLSGFAASASKLARALGHPVVDVLGFSMGGTVALQLALDHPDLVRRIVIAASGPGHVADAPPGPVQDPRVWPVATKPMNEDADFLFLFFEPSASSQAAGREHLARLAKRPDAFTAQVGAAAWQSQLKSALAVGTPSTSLLPKLRDIKVPVLVANGRNDIMVPTYNSYAMTQALPDARLLLYPDSGHGFLFQYPEDFARQVEWFLK